MTESLANLPIPPQISSQRWIRTLMLVSIFVSGAIVGTVGGSMWTRSRIFYMLQHPDQTPDRILPRIKSVLHLSDDQARQVEEIVRRHHLQMESLRAEVYPKQMSEFTAMRSEVAAVLTDEQRRHWTALCDLIEQRFLPPQPISPH